MKLEWSHVFLHVSDLPKMTDFYTRILGFEVREQTDSVCFFRN